MRRAKVILVACIYAILAPSAVLACTQRAIFGGEGNHRRMAETQFIISKQLAWQEGLLTSASKDSLRISFTSQNENNIWISGNTVFVSEAFLQLTAHHAFAYAVTRKNPELATPENMINYLNLLHSNAKNGVNTPVFTRYIGLTLDQCIEIWNDQTFPLDNVYPVTLSSFMRFWFLHEIGHKALGHKPTTDTDLSWKQEYEADRFALRALRALANDAVFVAFSGAYFRATMMFHSADFNEMAIPTVTHPPTVCRQYAVLEYIRSLDLQTSEITHNPEALMQLDLNRAAREFLEAGFKDSDTEC